jgi:hypothetical protein
MRSAIPHRCERHERGLAPLRGRHRDLHARVVERAQHRVDPGIRSDEVRVRFVPCGVCREERVCVLGRALAEAFDERPPMYPRMRRASHGSPSTVWVAC